MSEPAAAYACTNANAASKHGSTSQSKAASVGGLSQNNRIKGFASRMPLAPAFRVFATERAVMRAHHFIAGGFAYLTSRPMPINARKIFDDGMRLGAPVDSFDALTSDRLIASRRSRL